MVESRARQSQLPLALHGMSHAHPLRFHGFWLATGWALVLFITFESLTPRPIEFDVAQGDKYLHVLAYLVLAVWFANLYERGRGRLAAVAGCLALGIALEFAQLMTANRTFDLADMGADAIGVLIGTVLAPPRLPNLLHVLEGALGAFRKR